jgi:hypothetical protein
MHRTIKLPYTTKDAGFFGVLLELRRKQSRALRTAYCRLVGGMAFKELYRTLRAHPVGQGLHTWLLLSAMSKAKAVHKARPDGKAVFGGRKRLADRSQGKLSKEEWKARRLAPLWIEGHAKSYGS